MSDLNPYNNNYGSAIANDIVCSFLAAISVGVRLHVRRNIVGKTKIDDWLLLTSAVLFIVSNALDITSWVLVADEGVNVVGLASEVAAINMLPYLTAEVLIRGAWAVFYLSVIPPELGLQWQRWFIIACFSIYAALQMVCAFVALFQCGTPANIIPAQTDLSIVCVAPNILNFIYIAPYYLDAVLDWLMVFIPVYVVYKSTLDRRTKRSVAGILLLGAVASSLAVVVVVISDVYEPTEQGGDFSLDIIADILGTWETLLAIICLSIAAMKPLIQKYFGESQVSHSSLVDSNHAITPIDSASKEVKNQSIIQETLDMDC